jgi:hypothetical protein
LTHLAWRPAGKKTAPVMRSLQDAGTVRESDKRSDGCRGARSCGDEQSCLLHPATSAGCSLLPPRPPVRPFLHCCHDFDADESQDLTGARRGIRGIAANQCGSYSSTGFNCHRSPGLHASASENGGHCLKSVRANHISRNLRFRTPDRWLAPFNHLIAIQVVSYRGTKTQRIFCLNRARFSVSPWPCATY